MQWTCFHGQVLDYKKDIQINTATTWPTVMSLQQYSAITGEQQFTPALKEIAGADGLLKVYANGTFDYTIRGVHARISVQWDYEAPAGTGDTHYSLVRGSKAELMILQDKEQQYKPVLYIHPLSTDTAQMKTAFRRLEQKYPGIALKESTHGWEVVIPEQLVKVMNGYLQN